MVFQSPVYRAYKGKMLLATLGSIVTVLGFGVEGVNCGFLPGKAQNLPFAAFQNGIIQGSIPKQPVNPEPPRVGGNHVPYVLPLQNEVLETIIEILLLGPKSIMVV